MNFILRLRHKKMIYKPDKHKNHSLWNSQCLYPSQGQMPSMVYEKTHSKNRNQQAVEDLK